MPELAVLVVGLAVAGVVILLPLLARPGARRRRRIGCRGASSATAWRSRRFVTSRPTAVGRLAR